MSWVTVNLEENWWAGEISKLSNRTELSCIYNCDSKRHRISIFGKEVG